MRKGERAAKRKSIDIEQERHLWREMYVIPVRIDMSSSSQQALVETGDAASGGGEGAVELSPTSDFSYTLYLSDIDSGAHWLRRGRVCVMYVHTCLPMSITSDLIGLALCVTGAVLRWKYNCPDWLCCLGVGTSLARTWAVVPVRLDAYTHIYFTRTRAR
jgi:hypothetical protein